MTFWGLFALAVGAVSILTINIAGLMPRETLEGLHLSRLEHTSLSRLEIQLAALESETDRAHGENERLTVALQTSERNRAAVAAELTQLEDSLPAITEAATPAPGIDASSVTAAIGTDQLEAIDLFSPEPLGTLPEPAKAVAEPEIPVTQGLKTADITGNGTALAIGPRIDPRDAYLTWIDMNNRIGPLIKGLQPRLAGDAADPLQRLIAGPITDPARAEELCVSIRRIGLACTPTPFEGRVLPD